MALQKLTYTDGITVIPASNLNAIQDAIIALENQQGASEISDDLKTALLQIASKVAYIDDQGQTYYNALYNALYPPKTLFSITAVFTQGSTVVYDNASLDSLKSMLVVTAHYTDGTSEAVASNLYTLSGTLTVGTSTVTVSYNSKTTTFTVNVTAAPTLSSISAVYTQSNVVCTVDTLDSLKSDLVVTANYADSSTATVPAADYTLSGTLTAGTSTITVSYGGKTTTFTVTVRSAERLFESATWRSFEGSNSSVSFSNALDATFSTTGSTLDYSSGISVNGPNSACKQWSQIKNHRMRLYYTSNWTGIVTDAKLNASCAFAPESAYNSTRNKTISINITPSDTSGYFDVIIPTSDWSGWSLTGTVVDGDYFVARNYFLSPSSGAAASFTLRWYDLGAESL